MDSVKGQIKMALANKNITLTELNNMLNKKYNRSGTLQNLSSKINRNTLKYEEVQEIAEILNYDIKWIDKEI